MDLKEAPGRPSEDQGINEFPALLEMLWTSPKPVVAQVAGAARAGGVGIVAACDIAVASSSATFAFSEVRIGLVPAVISVPVLARLPVRAAHELMLTGEVFSADRAALVGLINASVEPEWLVAEVQRYVGMLAQGGPRALAATKALLTQDISAELQIRLQESAVHFASVEAEEGMRAFAEKRTPRWASQR